MVTLVWTTDPCQDQDGPWLTVQNLTFVDGNARREAMDRGGGAIFFVSNLVAPSRTPTDDARVHPAVAALCFEDQGLVLAALLARTPPGTLAARIGGAAGARCAAALEALAAEPKPARAATLASLITIFRAPVPPGIERVDPNLLRERLAREPTPILLAVTAGLPAEVRRIAEKLVAQRGEADQPMADLPEPVRREFQRIVFAGLDEGG